MKTIVDYINENYNTEKFEFQGKFKKRYGSCNGLWG